MLGHINRVKALADQLNSAHVAIMDGNIVMTLLESLPSLYEYLIVAMESRPIQQLTLDYMTSQLLHELLRHKENESYDDTTTLLSKQSRSCTNRSSTNNMCFYCNKKGYMPSIASNIRTMRRRTLIILKCMIRVMYMHL